MADAVQRARPSGSELWADVPDDAPSWVAASANPYLLGAFAPVREEREAEPLPVLSGEIPRDLDGLFVRNGPNPVHPPRGRHHWFDGDGMLHGVRFRGGRAHYRSRLLRTEGLAREAEAGRTLWPGYMEPPDPDAPPGAGSDGWLKDTANTDVVYHAGGLLALWYQCGVPLRVDAESFETLGPETFGGRLPRAVSAHAKADAATGELFFFDYSTRAPWLVYHVADARGRLLHSRPVELPGPRLPHDMALTARFAILMDLPLFWDEALLAKGVHKLRFHRDLPSRFALVARRGAAGEVRWFEAEPTYLYHVVNAWEEGDCVVMDACRTVPALPEVSIGDPALRRMLQTLKLEARLHRWRFDLRTGETREEDLDERNAEFPSIDARRLGRPTRYAYLPRIAADEERLLFDALLKYDTATGAVETHAFGAGRFGSEAPFAPRLGAAGEDEGYVVSFVTDERERRSHVEILDARDLAAGPVARVGLPGRVPVGFHATWVPGPELDAAAGRSA